MPRLTKSFTRLNNLLNPLTNANDPNACAFWELCQGYQQLRFLTRLETLLRSYLNNGVRHGIRERVVAVEDRHIIDVVFSKASKLKAGTRSLMIDGEIQKVTTEVAHFDKMPALRFFKWWEKEYTITKTNERLNKVIKQTWRVTAKDLVLTYIPTTQQLLATMHWKVQRFAKVGKYQHWSDSF